MLEIDTVKLAIEHHPSYELVDKISDIYIELIELATRPQLTEANIASIVRRRQLLQDEHEFTTALLERNQWLGETAGQEGSVVEAYLGTLAQIDEIVPRATSV
jgi:gamma-glutamyl:cysteine ligase YbdK (ATP-grasp superfamily)